VHELLRRRRYSALFFGGNRDSALEHDGRACRGCRQEPVDIYGPPGVEALVGGATQYLAVNTEIRWTEGKRTPLTDVFHAHDVLPGLVFRDRNVKVIAVENPHFYFPVGSPPYGKYKSYSYRFETADRVIVFMGDTGPSDAVMELAKGADILSPKGLPPPTSWKCASAMVRGRR
jgi:ribonuclease BN (tRNA processing enzyme)